jgi:branched-chain amino acid transport system substrate-binding protein
MNMNSKLGLSLIAAALLTVYGCGKEESKKAEAPKAPAAPAEEVVTVKIGHAGPLTGGIAHLGKDDENGVHLAVDEATGEEDQDWRQDGQVRDDERGRPGRCEDGPHDRAEVRRREGRRRSRHLNSGVSIPASRVYNQAGIPMISGSATNPKLTEQGFKNVFRTVGRDDQQGPAVAAYIANELKAKKVAIADDATAYGEGLANEVEKTLKAAGVQCRRAREDQRQGD